MESVLKEIINFRHDDYISIDRNNNNRYRVILNETDGSKTAYYFSTPIYNSISRKILEQRFHSHNNAFYVIGSDATITISDSIKMENTEGCCNIKLNGVPTKISDNELRCSNDSIFVTTNGFAYKAHTSNNGKHYLELEVSRPFMPIRENKQCFSVMAQEFRPFVVVSCMGSLDSTGNVIAPGSIKYEKITDTKYALEISAGKALSRYILFECNLYEPKMFQDTTVESINPYVNNVFGSTAFIGNTESFGEQWLYSRVDPTKLMDLSDKYINKVLLHIPQFSKSILTLNAHNTASRFCSFGSNWDNKVKSGDIVVSSIENNRYQTTDITTFITDSKKHMLVASEGLILKPNISNKGFVALATGDSCFSPQILEVNYK